MSSARCEVSCWQQRLECERNAKPQNCETDAHSTEPASFWCSCTAWRTFCSWVIKNQISSKPPIFLFSHLCQHHSGKQNVPTATENLQRDRLSQTVFGQNILCIPENCLVLHLWINACNASKLRQQLLRSKAFHCCDQKIWAASVQCFTLWQQATIEITSRDLVRATYMWLLFFAHIPSRSWWIAFNPTQTERLQHCYIHVVKYGESKTICDV